MTAQPDATSLASELQGVSRSVAGTVALAALGVIAAVVSAFLVSSLATILETEWPLLGEFLGLYVVQPGFGLVAAVYIWRSDDYNPLDRIQMPSLQGVAWIGIGAVGYQLAVRAVTPILPMVGLSHGPHTGTTAKWRVFLDQPEIIVPALVIMFVIMAPMEEILYRGVIHDALDPAIGSAGRVLVGGLLFGGMHFVFGGGYLTAVYEYRGDG
jgi:CAAX amino terminal protease family.